MHERPQDPQRLRAAFRDLHGARLHGFALILLLGDRALAAQLATETLDRLAVDAPRLRHPERAAAALRARLYQRALGIRSPRTPTESGVVALSRMGIDAPTATALAALSLPDRAALLAVEIERFGDEDVATILRTGAAAARRRARGAYRHYLDRHPGGDGLLRTVPGSIGERVQAVAARAMGMGR